MLRKAHYSACIFYTDDKFSFSEDPGVGYAAGSSLEGAGSSFSCRRAGEVTAGLPV